MKLTFLRYGIVCDKYANIDTKEYKDEILFQKDYGQKFLKRDETTVVSANVVLIYGGK